MTNAITVSGLSKKYRLRHSARPHYGSLRESITAGAATLARRMYSGQWTASRDREEEFWALKDVSFSLQTGERLGIIGRNGAGKSTLLKILSRITESTDGKVEIRGRVSSLLEVGTGFHPELTGRENIFLNGTILGMTSRDVRRKFDEIVGFAEIERFLDTPVKRYSSGMYVRLAFAVAAYLEPDILIVDEVLAVGDAQFQRRCLGRMEELSHSGRTVIFVTHNMDALVSLCTKGIVLEKGSVSYHGTAREARESYLSVVTEREYSIGSIGIRGGSGGISVRDVWLEDKQGERIRSLTRDTPASLCLDADVGANFVGRSDVEVAFSINTLEGHRLFTVISSWTNDQLMIKSPRMSIACDLPGIPLAPGRYLVDATVIFHGDTLDCVQHCAMFEVLPLNQGFHVGRLAEHGVLDLRCQFRQRRDPG